VKWSRPSVEGTVALELEPVAAISSDAVKFAMKKMWCRSGGAV
jgi:hypothetical protein